MQQIKKILCATDLSKFSDRFLSWGVDLCLRLDASFSVFHAIPPPLDSVARQIEFERGGEKEEKIAAAREKIKKIMAPFDIRWESFIRYGDPVLEAAKIAKKSKADMVLAASQGFSEFQLFFMGSVIRRMAQTMLQPFLVIPPIVSDTPRPKDAFLNILVACRMSKSDAYLKNFAMTFSEKFTAEICLVHVMESPVNETVVDITSAHYDDVQKRLEEKLSLQLKKMMPAKTHILRGVPGEELAIYAKTHGIDLIIAGMDDRPGRLIPTTTEALLRHLPCAVLTIPVKST
ncbi:universal stress protein [Desulfobacula sp.]|uniref:universal stress protein n=1 Tax=Desulfobacula sp. TaxID=2593537 RepID=UPI002632D86D|nr:universal stress protein [Desulfobacula sp.]